MLHQHSTLTTRLVCCTHTNQCKVVIQYNTIQNDTAQNPTSKASEAATPVDVKN